MDSYILGGVNLDDETIDPNYKKGFEHGYWLRRGNSEELDEIINRSKDTKYSSGLKAGRKEATREQVRERFKSNDNEQSQSPDKGIDVD